MKRIVIFLCSASLCFGFSLKQVANELSKASVNNEKSILGETKRLIEQTSGIINTESSNKALLDKIKNKQTLNIRIFGDSHIAGDFISQQLRILTDSTKSYGFLYPLYPPYHQHILMQFSSHNMEILNARKDEANSFMLGGVNASVVQLPASISLVPKNDLQTSYSTTIIFKSSNKKDVLQIYDGNNKSYKIKAKNPNIWQSITLNIAYPVVIDILHKDVELGGYIIKDNADSSFIENLGINGARSDLWLKWDREIMQKLLSLVPADLIILCYGSNDALYENFNESKFIANYSEFIDILKQTNPNASILLLSPPPVVEKRAITAKNSKGKKYTKTTYKLTKNFESTKLALQKLANKQEIMLFDMDLFIKQSGGKSAWEAAKLAKKDVHLLPLGYMLMAKKIYFELQKLQ